MTVSVMATSCEMRIDGVSICRSLGRSRRTQVGSGVPRHLWLLFRAAFFTVLLPGTVVAFVPWLLVDSGRWRFDIGPIRFAGVFLIVLGVAGLLWCIWDFAHIGRGTLAPVDPPRFVVRSGLYERVRNPMYVANLVTLVGEGIVFESAAIFAWAAFMWVANHLFVVLYEEPTLTRSFGANYESYRRSVPRWVPKLTRRQEEPSHR
jgi:protein-S-isoprenylcysteine O-methyltransferase Ste14